MPVRTLSEALDNLYTTTWQNMKGEIADNIFDASPFWFWMKKNGRLDTVEGGRFLTEPLRYAQSDNVTWVQKGSVVPLADSEFLTIANYDWRYLTDSIVRFGVDDQQNRGRNQIINLMNAKLENSQDTLVDTLETALFGASSGSPASINGLQDIVPADPTVTGATLGGIDPSVYTWWRNQTRNMTGVDYQTNLHLELHNMINDCTNNLRMDRTDLILSGQDLFERYHESLVDQKRFENTMFADAGFTNVTFQGIPWVWSPKETGSVSGNDGRVYVLNTRFLRFKYDPMLFFDMTEWKSIPDQVNDRAAQIVLAGNLTTSRRRVHGIMHTVDTD